MSMSEVLLVIFLAPIALVLGYCFLGFVFMAVMVVFGGIITLINEIFGAR